MSSEISFLKDENRKKDKSISELENEINSLKQINLENNVEILNVPVFDNKSAIETVLAIAKATCVAISDSNIIDAFTTRRKDRIVAKFSSPVAKRKFMKSIKEKNLRTLDVCKLFANHDVANKNNVKKIYVNDQLTAFNKKLLWNVKSRTKELKWKFAWVKDGKIMVKKAESSPALHIRNFEDIDNIL